MAKLVEDAARDQANKKVPELAHGQIDSWQLHGDTHTHTCTQNENRNKTRSSNRTTGDRICWSRGRVNCATSAATTSTTETTMHTSANHVAIVNHTFRNPWYRWLSVANSAFHRVENQPT